MNIGKEQIEIKEQQQLSCAQQQELFRKQKRQYLQIRQLRKKQQRQQKQRNFGQTSSDDDQYQFQIRPQLFNKNKFQQQKQLQKKENINFDLQTKQHIQQISVHLLLKKQWIQDKLIFNKNGGFTLPKYTYDIKGIRKIKIYNQAPIQKYYKTKITYYDTNQFSIALSKQQKINSLPLHYFLFAKIINNKLISAGVTLKENTTQIIHGAPQTIIAKAFKHGKLYKKSQVLGNWQQRYIVLNKDGIYSYKAFNQKPSIFINALQVKQLWTRFQQHQDMLVIKIKHGSTKTQFGIPFVDYVNSNCWLYHFYRILISEK